MLLVILYHSCLFWNKGWIGIEPITPILASHSLEVFCKWLGSFHIYAFTLVSGYIYSYVFFEKQGYTSYHKLLSRKAKRLLIPYVFCLLFWAIPNRVLLLHPKWSVIVDWFLLGENPEQLWFLLMLFWLFTFIYPFSKIINRSSFLAVLCAMAFFGVGIVAGHFLPNYFRIWSAFLFAPYFIIGMKIRQTNYRFNPAILVFLHVAMFFAANRIHSVNGGINVAFEKGFDLVFHSISACMAFSLLQSLSTHVKWHDSKFFKSLVGLSMPMYLFHEQIVHILMVAFNGVVNPFIHTVLNFTISSALSMLISVIFMRWKSTRFLIGENRRE